MVERLTHGDQQYLSELSAMHQEKAKELLEQGGIVMSNISATKREKILERLRQALQNQAHQNQDPLLQERSAP